MTNHMKLGVSKQQKPGPERYLGGASLPIKDALRGVRHGLRSFRDAAASIQSQLPGPVGTLGAATINHVDWLAAEVDRNSSKLVHRYLDPQITEDAESTAFSNLLTHPDAPILFAKLAYDNLKLVISYLAETLDQSETYFISEMLAAVAYQRAAGDFSETASETEKAAVLLVSMLETGIIRATTPINAAKASDDAVRRLARMACFTLILWLVIERDRTAEDEEMLLVTCSDLALALDETIDAADMDVDRLAELLDDHVGMV